MTSGTRNMKNGAAEINREEEDYVRTGRDAGKDKN